MMMERRGFLARLAASIAGLAAAKHVTPTEASPVRYVEPAGPAPALAAPKKACRDLLYTEPGPKTRSVVVSGMPIPRGVTVRLDGALVDAHLCTHAEVSTRQPTGRVVSGPGRVVTVEPLPGRDYDRCENDGVAHFQEFHYDGVVTIELPELLPDNLGKKFVLRPKLPSKL